MGNFEKLKEKIIKVKEVTNKTVAEPIIEEPIKPEEDGN